jgi:hypothetical protein
MGARQHHGRSEPMRTPVTGDLYRTRRVLRAPSLRHGLITSGMRAKHLPN